MTIVGVQKELLPNRITIKYNAVDTCSPNTIGMNERLNCIRINISLRFHTDFFKICFYGLKRSSQHVFQKRNVHVVVTNVCQQTIAMPKCDYVNTLLQCHNVNTLLQCEHTVIMPQCDYVNTLLQCHNMTMWTHFYNATTWTHFMWAHFYNATRCQHHLFNQTRYLAIYCWKKRLPNLPSIM